MRTLLTLIVLCAALFTGCEEGKQMAGNIMSEPVVTEPVGTDLGTQETMTYAVYDVNQDGIVNNLDLELVSAALGQNPPANPRVDVNQDGSVNGQDIILVNNHIGDPTTTKEPTPAVEPEYLKLTYENALDLQPGMVYRMRPNTYYSMAADIGSDEVIADLIWGNIDDLGGELIEGQPSDLKILLCYRT